MFVAFRSAKVASYSDTFTEQKTTIIVMRSINSQPFREGGVSVVFGAVRFYFDPAQHAGCNIDHAGESNH